MVFHPTSTIERTAISALLTVNSEPKLITLIIYSLLFPIIIIIMIRMMSLPSQWKAVHLLLRAVFVQLILEIEC
jgi:hypothetical protein